MKTKQTTTLIRLIGATLLALVTLSLTSCLEDDGPTKPAGPGGDRMQPYSPDDGQYR
jgi:hypothetical protein